MLEQEFKYLITAEFYSDLKEKFLCGAPLEITNTYYLDTQGLLQGNGVTVRIREESGRRFFQVKQKLKHPPKTEGALTIREEYSSEIESFAADKILSAVRNLTQLDVQDLYPAGQLQTFRGQIELGNSSVLCLDRNIYLDSVDYEAEIEYSGEEPSARAKAMAALLEKNSLPYCGGKRTRFLRRLRQLAQQNPPRAV